jgi:ABC-2 type transport system permease protein
MSTQGNMMDVLPAETPAARVTAPTQAFLWSLRRELWENRSIFMGALTVAGLILLGVVIQIVKLEMGPIQFLAADPQNLRKAFLIPFEVTKALLIATGLVIGFFYSLDALHGERRDRSILFWKSLPVSDRTTVLAKAAIPLAVLPAVVFVTIVAMQLILLLLSYAVFPRGADFSAFWSQLSLFQGWGELLYRLVALHILWHAPVYCYLLMVSAWARRATFLWAIVPLAGICILEKLAIGTSYFQQMLLDRLTGGVLFVTRHRQTVMIESGFPANATQFLLSPGLWIGLAFAILFLAVAIMLRRRSGVI